MNVEPVRSRIELFVRARPDDVNVHAAVGPRGTLTLYEMDRPALSTVDPASAERTQRQGAANVVGAYEVPVIPLAEVCGKVGPIDLLSVDVEGFDLNALRSGDWEKHRPRAVLVETNQDRDAIASFMTSVGYRLVWTNHTNSIFTPN